MTEWHDRWLISTERLAELLDDPDLRLFDSTVHLRPSTSGGPYQIESGRADYEAAHIPGAGFLDLPADLSDRASSLAFMMPPTAELAAALGAAGVGPKSKVVIYSGPTPMWATRVWWMLRASGFEAAVLDGGLAKWRAEGRPVEAGTRRYPPAELSLAARPELWADKHAVLAAIEDGGVCTINALSPSVHSGESATNYGRKGHIKGSRNVPYAALLKPDGTYRDDAELRALFDRVGAFERPRAICYCGGGISATMDALALTRLGHPSVAVYDGSMSEWTRDATLPMETGA